MAEVLKFASSQSALVYLSFFFAFVVIGFTVRAISLRREVSRHADLFEFRQRFIDWANGRYADHPTYMQLISDSPRIQAAMGHWGIYATFTPPFSSVSYKNWPIILNGLPAIRQSAGHYLISDRLAADYAEVIDEALLRALGTLEACIKTKKSELLNPISLFREGLVYTMTLPFLILAEFGLLTKRAYNRIVASLIVRGLAFGITALGIFGSIVGLTVDWEPFTAKLHQLRLWTGF